MRILSLSHYSAWISLWCMIALCCHSHAWGQTETDSIGLYKLQIGKDLPFEKVMQEEESFFFSANRRLDSLKRIALNASILTKERLRQSGVNTIPEALQLLPEFVLKTKANGLYDVEYRGIKNTYAIHQLDDKNKNLLVLINAIPLNDALSGEIWWEAIPVSIEDIERIEVIHSPHGTWYGYGGTLGVVNLITKKSDSNAGTKLNANLQAGQFQSQHYHGSLNLGLNDRISIRLGANFQVRQRFQEAYFIRSASRYITSDSLLFFQPEAFQTHLYTDLALQSSGFHLSSAYQWNDSIRLSVDLGNQSSQAQSLFLPAEEIPSTTRESRIRWVNIHFSAPSWRAYVFHQSGDKDYAKGYTALQYQTARTGARLEYYKGLGRYGFLFGTETIKDQYSPRNTISGISIFEGALPSGQWSQLLLSLYLQQTAAFFKNRLYLESGQRVYQNLQELNYPLGYHFALQWFLTEGTSLQLRASQVVQTTQQLLVNEPQLKPIKTSVYELGIHKALANKGMLKATLFNQTHLKHRMDVQNELQMPEWGSTLEAWYQINRWTVRGHATRLFADILSDHSAIPQGYPAWVASISGNFSTFFDRINLNAGLFYYSEYSERIDNNDYLVPDQWVVNTKFAYRLWNQHQLYVNVRNLLNEEAVVVPFADQNHRLIMLGLNIAL